VSPRMPSHDPADVFGSFVRELAASPERTELLDRLRLGHEPDEHGWCRHAGHAYHWERHPCPVLRLATLASGPGRQE
jgi:hypothetical protein